MLFDARRSTVLACQGMVATSQPLAAVVGLKMLMQGGNAVDAAVAAAAALNVVEPMSTGVGGDAFALVWMAKEKRMYAMNASGRAPAMASIDELRSQGLTHIPPHSPHAVSIPGTVDGWQTILETLGSMSLYHVLQPAIQYAERGFPVSDIIAHQWELGMAKLSRLPSGKELMPDGRAPRLGEVVRLPQLAGTLRAIAEGGRDAFYKGEIAEKIATFIQQQGGWITTEDLAKHTSTWDEPIFTNYRGVTCWECPPNGQGLAALIALNIVEGFDIAAMGFQTPGTYHHLIEAMRLGLADALFYVADPGHVPVPTAQLLSKQYAATRRSAINRARAMDTVAHGHVPRDHGSDTVCVSAVDSQGNACSFINSLYEQFGTGLVVPGTGIVLHNRAVLFSLDPTHPNALAPGKRPYHTLMPAMATRAGELWLSYGMTGGFQQPQGHLQIMVNMVDFGLDPQAALNARRFSVRLGEGVALEEDASPDLVRKLQRRGHPIFLVQGYDRTKLGVGQIIQRDLDTGALRGGSDPRKDGCAVGW